MSTDRTRDLTDRLTDAYLEGDRDAIARLLAEDVVHHPPESLGVGPRRGRDETAAALAEPPGGEGLQASTIRREVALTVVDGDGALVKIRLTAHTVDDAEYKNELVWIYGWRDGAIVRIDEFRDTLGDADQGILKDFPAGR